MTKKEEIATMATQQVATTQQAYVAQQQSSRLQEFNSLICSDGWNKYLEQVLGEHKGEFINNLVALVSGDSSLQMCKPDSLIYTALKATALNLPIDKNLGFAWIIKYGDSAQFQIGYKGFVQLAIRTGFYSGINVTDVRQGEIKKRDRLTGKIEFDWIDDDEVRDKLKVVGYVSYFELTNGFKAYLYMTSEKIDAHAKEFSKNYNSPSSLWKTDFDSMARKTVLKLLLSKVGILSVNMAKAQQYDQAVFDDKNTLRYADNPKADSEVIILQSDTEGGDQ